ncbi:hypothetical protein [Streptomyces sp. NPDC017095]|uniref:hypothetical protein n=1 Tax=Streptomyces sp. NPDC017095 TaxID=3364977 RepID=UPI0037A8505E
MGRIRELAVLGLDPERSGGLALGLSRGRSRGLVLVRERISGRRTLGREWIR